MIILWLKIKIFMLFKGDHLAAHGPHLAPRILTASDIVGSVWALDWNSLSALNLCNVRTSVRSACQNLRLFPFFSRLHSVFCICTSGFALAGKHALSHKLWHVNPQTLVLESKGVTFPVEKVLNPNRRWSVKWTLALCVKLQMLKTLRQRKKKKKSYFSLNLYWWPGRNQHALQFCKGEDV